MCVSGSQLGCPIPCVRHPSTRLAVGVPIHRHHTYSPNQPVRVVAPPANTSLSPRPARRHSQKQRQANRPFTFTINQNSQHQRLDAACGERLGVQRKQGWAAEGPGLSPAHHQLPEGGSTNHSAPWALRALGLAGERAFAWSR